MTPKAETGIFLWLWGLQVYKDSSSAVMATQRKPVSKKIDSKNLIRILIKFLFFILLVSVSIFSFLWRKKLYPREYVSFSHSIRTRVSDLNAPLVCPWSSCTLRLSLFPVRLCQRNRPVWYGSSWRTWKCIYIFNFSF